MPTPPAAADGAATAPRPGEGDDVSIEIAAGTVYALLGPVFVPTASVLVRRSAR